MARTTYKNVGITISVDTGVGTLAWIMHDNLPEQYKIESIELSIGLDKKVAAAYTLKINDEETITKGANEIFKSKQALIKAL